MKIQTKKKTKPTDRAITALARQNCGSNFYRVRNPLKELSKTTQVYLLEPGTSSHYIQQCIQDSDVLYLPLPCEQIHVAIGNQLRQLKTQFCLDFDDDFFSVSPFSPSYSTFGVSAVSVRTQTGLVDMWKEGVNIDCKANQTRLDNVKRTCGLADKVSVTCESLKTVYSEFVSPAKISVLPNALDLDLWNFPALAERKTEQLRIGWSGGDHHLEDLMEIRELLEYIVKKIPDVVFVILGNFFSGVFQNIPKKNIEFHDWVHIEAYAYKQRFLDLDLSLIPLKETKFNKSISDIKWLEQAVLDVPAIASFAGAYKRLPERLGIFVENNTDCWIQAFDYWLKNRDEFVVKAKKYAQSRSTAKLNQEWQKHFN